MSDGLRLDSPAFAARPFDKSPEIWSVPRIAAPLMVIATLFAVAWFLSDIPGPGRTLAFALLLGGGLGVALQRTRFCFLCHARDFFDHRRADGLLAIVLAIAVGTIGYHTLFGAWMPVPAAPRLPPDVHIGPVSWALVAAGLSFGLGMAISGSCISAHLYRLGEGSATSPFALIGAVIGFILGYVSWNPIYLSTIIEAPVVWLPHYLGYGGSLAVQLLALGLIAAFLWRRGAAAIPDPSPRPADQNRPTVTRAVARLFEGRWPYWTGGIVIGVISILTILRLKPLGVTSAIGTGARSLADQIGILPAKLEGLDGFAGCATTPGEGWLTPNLVLILGLVAGAFAAALASGQFTPRRPTGRDITRGLIGGILLGWGSMIGLGCTIGTLLSGGMAAALSGWVFGASLLVGTWVGLQGMKRL